MGMDYWLMATKVNPEYDVPWFNLYSTLKGRGDFPRARTYLQNAIKSKTCHFKVMWTKELEDFDKELIKNRNNMSPQQFPPELQYKYVNEKDEVIDATPPKPLPDKEEVKEILKDLILLDNKGNRITIKIKEMIKVKIPQYPREEMKEVIRTLTKVDTGGNTITVPIKEIIKVMVFEPPKEQDVDTTRVHAEGPARNINPTDLRSVGTG